MFLHGLFDCFDMTRIWNTHRQTFIYFSYFVHLSSFLATRQLLFLAGRFVLWHLYVLMRKMGDEAEVVLLTVNTPESGRISKD